MEIALADQHVYVLEERLSSDEVRQKAMDRRTNAFGTSLGNLLQRPRGEDIELLSSQRRLEPFWHVASSARYVYDRTRQYTVAASGAEVAAVTVKGDDHTVQPIAGRPSFVIDTIEHCRDEFAAESFTDAVSGEPVADGALLVAGPREEVADLAALAADGTFVAAPEQRASFVIRHLLATVMKPIQADTLLEETVEIRTIDLCYRPWWAFEFHWKPKDKQGTVEIDAITGHVRAGQPLAARISGSLNRDALFDIGADTVGLLVPGGSVAVKVARLALDKSHRQATRA
jgi:hypothetical protein